MSYSNLFEGWRHFVAEDKKKKYMEPNMLQDSPPSEEPGEEPLNEMKEDTFNFIADYLGGEVVVGDLRFKNLFGDKLRIIKEMEASGEGLRSTLVRFFEDNGWEIVIEPREVQVKKTVRGPDGSEQRVASTETRNDVFVTKKFEVDEEKAAKFTKGDKGPKDQVRKIKIGKVLAKLANSKLFDNDLDYADRTKHWDRIETPQGPYKQAEFPDIRNHYVGERDYREELGSSDLKINHWNELWNKKSAYYSENPDEFLAKEKKYVIFSRDPVDVFRMSDHKNWHSCHSPPEKPGGEGSHFHCAAREARNSGFIAYLVDEDEFDREIGRYGDDEDTIQEKLSSFDDEEIFADEDRDVSGIDPHSRVRVRRYVNYQDEVELAIPETRVYPSPGFPGFYNAVKGWLHDKQEDPQQIIDPDKDDGDVNDFMHKFYLTGGSYADNGADDLFNSYFDTKVFSGNVDHDDEGEPDEEFKSIGVNDQYERRVEELNNSESYDNIEYWGEVSDEGWEEQPYVTFGARGTVKFKAEERAPNEDIEEFPEVEHADLPSFAYNDADGDEIIEEIQSDLDNAYFDTPSLQYKSDGVEVEETGDWDIVISLNFDQEGFEYDPDGYENFIDSLGSWDQKWLDVRKIIAKVLRKHGILQRSAVEIYADTEKKFQYFDIDEATGGYEIETSTWWPIGRGLNLPGTIATLTEKEAGQWRRAQEGEYTIEWDGFAMKLLERVIGKVIGMASQEDEEAAQGTLELNEARNQAGWWKNTLKIDLPILRDAITVWLKPEPRWKGDPNSRRIEPFSESDYEPMSVEMQMKVRFDLDRTLPDIILKNLLKIVDYFDDHREEILQEADAILQDYNIEYKKHVAAQVKADQAVRDEVIPDLNARRLKAGAEMDKTDKLWQSLIPDDVLRAGVQDWLTDYSPSQEYMNVYHRHIEKDLGEWEDGAVFPDRLKSNVRSLRDLISYWEDSAMIRNQINQLVASLMTVYNGITAGNVPWPTVADKIVGRESQENLNQAFRTQTVDNIDKRWSLLADLLSLHKRAGMRGVKDENDQELGDYGRRQLAQVRSIIKRYERKLERETQGVEGTDLVDEIQQLKDSADKVWNYRFRERMSTGTAEMNIKRAEYLLGYITDNNIHRENELPRRELSQLNYLRGLYRAAEEGGQAIAQTLPFLEERAHHQFISKLDRSVAYLNKAFESTADHDSVFTRRDLITGAEGARTLRPLRDRMYQIYEWASQNIGNLQTFMDSEMAQELKDSYKLMDRWLEGQVGMGVGDYDGLVDEVQKDLPSPTGTVSESLTCVEYNSELLSITEKEDIFRESLKEVFNRLGHHG